MEDPELSVVTMLYRSQAFVREFHARLTAAASQLTERFEVVYVDDGSPDASGALVRELARNDPRVSLVELSRNFGHHPAALAGLAQSRGRRVLILDVDLEEQPEWLPGFWTQMDASGADVVFGVNDVRRGPLLRRLLSALFWRLFNALSEIPVPANPCTMRLMTRGYVDALLSVPDRSLFLAGNYAWLGFRQEARHVQKGLRPGKSSYSPRRLVTLLLDAITSFSSYPLRLIFGFGIVVATIALAAGLALIVYKVLEPARISLGWPSIMVSLWFLGGLVIAFLGVIGIYLSKVFYEAKGRPRYVVRALHRGAGSS